MDAKSDEGLILELGLYYGTQAKPPTVVIGGLKYKVGNLDKMSDLGYHGPTSDGLPVLVAIKPNQLVCHLVDLEHVEFKPPCRPVGTLPVLESWVVQDVERRQHVVEATGGEDALVTLRERHGFTPGEWGAERVDRPKALLYYARVWDGERDHKLHVRATTATQAGDMLHRRFGEDARFEEVSLVPSGVLVLSKQ